MSHYGLVYYLSVWPETYKSTKKVYPFIICIIMQLNYTACKPSRAILSFCFCDKVWRKFSVERIFILIWLKFSVFQNVRQYGMICKRYRALIRDLNSGIKTWKVVFILPMYVSSRSCVLSKERRRVAAFLKKFSKNIVVFVCTSASWMWSVNWKVQSTQARSIRSNKKFDLIRENVNPWERS